MGNLNIYQIIEKKRNAQILSHEEIEYFIQCVTKHRIPDYQITALLMAIFIRGMNQAETFALTKAMVQSGKQLTFNDPCVIDKHSTGGVGDKTSFIVGPLAAACGVKVPMIAGRGLAHTGGTIDKIESVPGFKTHISLETFSSLLKQNHIVLSGQTEEIAPADKDLYALRDVTATVNSIPLITASIMSKKLAEGIAGLVMDLKFGSGSFMKTKTEGRQLADSIVDVGKRYGISLMVFMTNMDWPLGNTVGHSLEIRECIETLKGKGPKDLEELSLELAAGMIDLAGKSSSFKEAREKARQALDSGEALRKFEQLLKGQGGKVEVISDSSLLPVATERHHVKARSEGYIASFKNDKIGLMVLEMGGGRRQKTDKIDFTVGIKFAKKPGDILKKGEVIFTFYHHPSQKKLIQSLEDHFFQYIMKISTQRPNLEPLISEVLVEKV